MITFTDKAREEVLSFLGQSEGGLEALRISLRGGEPQGTDGPNFDLTLVALEERTEYEREVDLGDFSVLVPETAVDQLEGATVDYVERVNETALPAKICRISSRSPSG